MDEKARRDDVIARELSNALRAHGAAASGPHLDAEAVAAWTERRLDAAESESVEIHLASCTDCQAIVATLARTAPEPADAPGAGWWSSLRRPWLVPAAAAVAAALVLWVVQPQPEPPAPRLEGTLARSDAPAPAAAETPQFERAEPTPEASQLAPRDLEAESKLLRKAEPGRAAAPPAAVGSVAEPARQGDANGFSAARVAAAPPPPAPASPEAAAGARAADAAVVGEAPVVDAPAARKESVTITGQTPAPPPAERREQQAATAAQQRSLNDAARFAAALRAAELNVTSADGRGRWRRSGAVLQFAPDATAAFRAVQLPLDANALVAGSAPGGTVCWLAGRGGVVLVSTNGTQFTRVGTPTTLDLVQVAATDARTAVVTAADGRRFRTADQGATWTPQ